MIGNPVWSRDGREIAYASLAGIYRVAADGSTSPEPVSKRGIPTDWSHDGQILSFGSQAGPVVSLALSSVATHAVTELGPGSEGQFSPDGHWLAHGGQDGVIVQRFPDRGARIQVTSYGAWQPRWSRDGRQVFYITTDKKLMAADFDPSTATVGTPRVLFQTRIIGSALIGFQYDVAPDGRFLVNSITSPASPLTLLTGWAGRLKR
jgi:eukaryotic-like serine/threonine-protein kinase